MSAIHLLQTQSAFFVLAAGLLGLIVGSFLNVVIYRLPVMLEREWRGECAELLELEQSGTGPDEPFTLVVPRSRCPQCGHTITALENIPVVSYLFLRGKCSACKAHISSRYPLVETLSALLTAGVAWHFGFGVEAAGAMLLTWALVALSFIDFDHQILPDKIVMPFLWFGLALNLDGTYTTIQESVIGAMAGYLVLWSIYHVFRLLTGKEGMGYGDFKLLALFGAWLGWKVLPAVVLLSSAVGAVIGITLIVARGHDRNIPIPFGPYLAIAGWIALLWGQDLTTWYLGWSTRG